MERNFCYRCGTKLDQKEEFMWWCPSCEYHQYANPKPCVDIALFNSNGNILMATRGIEPEKGMLDLPGGFVDVGDTIESALLREIKEELDLDPDQLTTPVYVGSRMHDYPFGKETYKNVVLVFTAQLLADESLVKAQDDVASVAFMPVESLKVGGIGSVASEEHLRLIKLAHHKHLQSLKA